MSETEKFLEMLAELGAEFENHSADENGEEHITNISAEEILSGLLQR